MNVSGRYYYWVLVLLILLSIGIYTSYNATLNSALLEAQNSLTFETRFRSRIIEAKLRELRSNILFLQSVPPIQGIIRASNNQGVDPLDGSTGQIWKKRLQSIFTSYLKAHSDAYQVRFVGIANDGKELVRVDKLDTGIVITPESRLQKKSSRDYFKQIVESYVQGIYFSDITLNREYGQIQVPYNPTLRVALKVFDEQGEAFGFVIINYNVENLFKIAATNIPNEALFFILNDSDHYLYHPDPQKSFAFELNLDQVKSWSEDFSVITTNREGLLNNYQYQTEEFLAFVDDITLTLGSNSIQTVVMLPQQRILANAKNAAIYASLIVSGSFILLAVFYLIYRHTISQRELLNLEKARNHSIVDSSQDAIIGESVEGRITDWNTGAALLFGFAKDEVLDQFTRDVIQGDHEYEDSVVRQQLLTGSLVKPFETERVTKRGEKLTVSISASPIKDDTGKIVGISKIIRDISEQKKIQSEIQELNRSLEKQVEDRAEKITEYLAMQSAIFDNTDHAMIVTDNLGIVTHFNPAAEKMLGYEAEQIVGKVNPTLWHQQSELINRAKSLSNELAMVVEPDFDACVIKSKLKLKNEFEWNFINAKDMPVPVYQSVTALMDDNENITGYIFLAKDISEIVENRLALETLKDQLTKAAEVAQLGIWSWNIETNTLVWNKQMFEIYGLDEKEIGDSLRYEHWYNALVEEQKEKMVAELKQAVENDTPFEQVFRIQKPDGSVRHIQASAIIERNLQGKALLAIGVNWDITDQVNYEENLQASKKAADLASKTKSEFVANMSHEIRTPMNAIIGLLQLLRSTELDARQMDFVVKSNAAAQSLLRILNDILDFSKVEAGKLELDPHPFCVSDLIDNVCSVLTSNIGDSEIELIINLDPNFPDYITLDSLRLQQVIINLASNAIKFTKVGFVEVKLFYKKIRNTHWLCCDVRDTGIGIDKEKIEKIFEEFSQAETSTERQYGGTGLGLAISRKLISLMGGEISVVSELNKGSTFSFKVPFKVASLSNNAKVAEALKTLNVLVVDDREEALEANSHVVETLGWSVTKAGDGSKALDCVKLSATTKPFDLILMDWDMPVLNGWDTSLKIKDIEDVNAPNRILIVTAYGKDLDLPDYHNGAKVIEGIIEKPITPSVLLNRASEIFSRDGSNDSEKMPKAPVKSTIKRLNGINILLVEDNATNRLVAREILKDEGANIFEAEDGYKAISILRHPPIDFDVVLMDIQMPGIDGYQTTKRIRDELNLTELPILAMTANVLPSDKLAAIESGMNAHISKPFHLDELVGSICRQTFNRHVVNDELDEGNGEGNSEGEHKLEADDKNISELTEIPNDDHTLKQSEKTLNNDKLNDVLVDVHSALERIDNNKKVYLSALDMFFVDSPELIQKVTDKWPADLEDATIAVHSLKGLSATLGAYKLSSHCFEIEQLLNMNNSEVQYSASTNQPQHNVQSDASAVPLMGQMVPDEKLKADYVDKVQNMKLIYADSLSMLHKERRQLEQREAEDDTIHIDPQALQKDIQHLYELLKASNMEAINVYRRIKHCHNANIRQVLEDIELKVSALDFELAAKELEPLLARDN
ncbi:PAS domain S-box protein [Aliikangiella maris]|uniref:histidine kinase n=2 Tax=Aliikangiella maris TaxID=3162458 RepID=A0ABV3MJL3_9GAMM